MDVTLGLFVDAAAAVVDSHRRDGALRRICEAGRRRHGRDEVRRRDRAQLRAAVVQVQDRDIGWREGGESQLI